MPTFFAWIVVQRRGRYFQNAGIVEGMQAGVELGIGPHRLQLNCSDRVRIGGILNINRYFRWVAPRRSICQDCGRPPKPRRIPFRSSGHSSTSP